MGQKDVNLELRFGLHPDGARYIRPWCHREDVGLTVTGPECSPAEYALIVDAAQGGILDEVETAVEAAWPGWLKSLESLRPGLGLSSRWLQRLLVMLSPQVKAE